MSARSTAGRRRRCRARPRSGHRGVVLSRLSEAAAASAETTANCTAVKAIGRLNGEARPVTTTCSAQNKADTATSLSPSENVPRCPPPSSQVPSGGEDHRRPYRRARPYAVPGPGDERRDDDVERGEEAGVGHRRGADARLLQPGGDEERHAAGYGDLPEAERCAGFAPGLRPSRIASGASARAATAPREAMKASGPMWAMADFWNMNATPQTAAANSRAMSACRRDMSGVRRSGARLCPFPAAGNQNNCTRTEQGLTSGPFSMGNSLRLRQAETASHSWHAACDGSQLGHR